SSGQGMPARNDEELHHMTSYEALEGWRRLVEQRGIRSEEEPRMHELESMRAKLEALPRMDWVTPIVVSLDGGATLDEFVGSRASVPFDLDGDGVDELWPWPTPGAGWLVWDPQHRGEITSGLQLFGTASAWLFFQDGYRVLDALDDDRDGALRGRELAGIAVWFDRDMDGVSHPGEVVPVEELGIAALRTDATLALGESLRERDEGRPRALDLRLGARAGDGVAPGSARRRGRAHRRARPARLPAGAAPLATERGPHVSRSLGVRARVPRRRRRRRRSAG